MSLYTNFGSRSLLLKKRSQSFYPFAQAERIFFNEYMQIELICQRSEQENCLNKIYIRYSK
jgi:hypothetical protein